MNGFISKAREYARGHAGTFSACVAAGSLVATQMASAAIDVTAVVTSIGDALAPIAAIGGAVLGVIVVIKTWKWVRRAM